MAAGSGGGSDGSSCCLQTVIPPCNVVTDDALRILFMVRQLLTALWPQMTTDGQQQYSYGTTNS